MTKKLIPLSKECLENPQLLESKAKELSIEDLHEIFDAVDRKELHLHILHPLFKGLTPQQFRQTLISANPFPLCLPEATFMTEMQNQLRTLSDELEKSLKEDDEWLFQQKILIDNLQSNNPNHEKEAVEIHNSLHAREKKLFETNELAKRGLLLAWNSRIPDLVDLMSWIKEHCLILLGSENDKYITLHSLRHALANYKSNAT